MSNCGEKLSNASTNSVHRDTCRRTQMFFLFLLTRLFTLGKNSSTRHKIHQNDYGNQPKEIFTLHTIACLVFTKEKFRFIWNEMGRQQGSMKDSFCLMTKIFRWHANLWITTNKYFSLRIFVIKSRFIKRNLDKKYNSKKEAKKNTEQLIFFCH